MGLVVINRADFAIMHRNVKFTAWNLKDVIAGFSKLPHASRHPFLNSMPSCIKPFSIVGTGAPHAW